MLLSLLIIRDFQEEKKKKSPNHQTPNPFSLCLSLEKLFALVLTVPYSFPFLFIAMKRALLTPNRLTTPLSTVDISKRPKKIRSSIEVLSRNLELIKGNSDMVYYLKSLMNLPYFLY